jgi:competence protein ComEC
LKRAFLVILLISLFTGFIITTSTMSASTGTLRVSFINVGQGDAALVQDPNGFDILIDGGLQGVGPTVVAYLREQGVDELEVMVASHADGDHIGGLISVLAAEDITVERVYYNGYAGQTTAWFNFETAVANAAVTLEAAQYPATYSWGDTNAQVLNPIPGLDDPNTNDASVVLLLEHGVNKFLFTGDINAAIEALVVGRGLPSQVEVLKVSHHGSDTGSSEFFLQSARPQQAVISVGTNSYGHPGSETLARLSASGASVWRTDHSGNIIVTSDGISYTIGSQFVYDVIFLPNLVFLLPMVETPVSTVEPTLPNSSVAISDIFYRGLESRQADEYVQIENRTEQVINLQGWTLRDEAGTVFTFPNFSMEPGRICRVYTNQVHTDWCGFSYGRGVAIWNDDGDCASLRDERDNLVSNFCYGFSVPP